MKIEIKNGVVTKDGEEIGKIDGDTCTLAAVVGPTVKGAIRRESGLPELQFIIGSAPDGEEGDEGKEVDASKPSLADMTDDELATEMKRRGLIQEAPQVTETPVVVQPPVIERDLSAVDRLHKLADEGKIPRPPEKHPAMGDKDPAYVAWFKQHATPAEIATRYPDNRRVPATVREFQQAAEQLQGRLPGEKKDTNKENDFTDEEGA
jgi:hypothetical protein